MAKALGYDIVEFFASEWPEDWYVDDSALTVDVEGKNIFSDEDIDQVNPLPLGDTYTIEDFGYLAHNKGAPVNSLAHFFRKWKEGRDTIVLHISVPKDKESEVRDQLKDSGIKVL